MNRRKFLNNSIKACASSLFIEQLLTKQYAFGQTALLNAIANVNCSDKILVVVQLFGGNDGLNTFIPLDQYSTLQSVRANVTIPENNLRFATSVNNGMAQLGTRSTITSKYPDMAFHPALEGLYNLFDQEKMSIVMGCSYPNPDLSHFRATDIWMMGADSNEFLVSGWVGRNLESLYQDYGFPDPTELTQYGYTDPLSINMGSISPLSLNDTKGIAAGISTTTINNDYPLLGGYGDAAPASCAGEELTFLRKVAVDTDLYNKQVVDAASKVTDSAYPASNLYGNDMLSRNLRNVAKLIKGGMQTRVYTVSQGGYDTHTQQVGSNAHDGNHTSLLYSLSRAISGFQDDIEKMGMADKVVGVVFTEFGRTVRSNGGKGTDHGVSTPVWLFGTPLKGGRYGTNPQLYNPDTNKIENQVPMQYDYRSVYYSILKDWFCLSQTQLESVFGGAEKTAKYASQYHDLFREPFVTANKDDIQHAERTNKLLNTHPNPLSESGIIAFNTSGGSVTLELYDVQGHKIKTIMDTNVNPGHHEVPFEKEGLKPGMYVVRMKAKDFTESVKMVVK